MQVFLQSAFLQALAYSLIASIWQMALLWLITVVLLKLVKLTSAQKFNIAFIAQASGLAFFISTFFTSYAGEGNTVGLAGNFSYDIQLAIAGWMPYLSIIYLCILVWETSRFIFLYNGSKRLKTRNLVKISPDNRLFVQRVSALFSLHKEVRIFLSEKITCPLTIGFFKPVILIPVAAINHLTPPQMEAVILHELAHIKRADYLLFILQSIVEKIFFFNVFSKMLGDIIERERENACDDWVLQFRYNSMHYAEALFKLGRLKAYAALAMPLTGKKDGLLLFRIKRLLHHHQELPARNYRPHLLGLFSLVVAAGLFFSSFPTPGKEKMAVIGNPVMATPTAATQPVLKENQLPVEKETAVGNAVKKDSKNTVKAGAANDAKAVKSQAEERHIYNDEADLPPGSQNYLVKLQESIDSLRLVTPDYRQAVNSQVVFSPEVLQKAISYQNFKQIENMLAVSGNAITVTEADSTKNSYQKKITIEATDQSGNKHIYTVIVDLYQ